MSKYIIANKTLLENVFLSATLDESLTLIESKANKKNPKYWPDSNVLSLWSVMTGFDVYYNTKHFSQLKYNIRVRVILHQQMRYTQTKDGIQKPLSYKATDPRLTLDGATGVTTRWVELAYYSGDHFDLVIPLEERL